jgi:hypothetical protein
VSIGMKNGVVRILPALLHESRGRPLLVLNEAIAVAVAALVNPTQCTFDVWPESLEKRQVSCSRKVGTGESNKKGRSVYATVVPGEGHFFRHRHFAPAHFMKDFSGLGILFRYFFGGLRLREISKTPSAIRGAIHKHSSAVIIPSRRNTVLNHGTPAYG